MTKLLKKLLIRDAKNICEEKDFFLPQPFSASHKLPAQVGLSCCWLCQWNVRYRIWTKFWLHGRTSLEILHNFWVTIVTCICKVGGTKSMTSAWQEVLSLPGTSLRVTQKTDFFFLSNCPYAYCCIYWQNTEPFLITVMGFVGRYSNMKLRLLCLYTRQSNMIDVTTDVTASF